VSGVSRVPEGSFAISLGGATSGALPLRLDAAALQSALRALAGRAGGAAVGLAETVVEEAALPALDGRAAPANGSGVLASAFRITFVGVTTPLPLLSARLLSNESGEAVELLVARSRALVPPETQDVEVRRPAAGAIAAAPGFVCAHRGATTALLPWAVAADALAAALRTLPTVGGAALRVRALTLDAASGTGALAIPRTLRVSFEDGDALSRGVGIPLLSCAPVGGAGGSVEVRRVVAGAAAPLGGSLSLALALPGGPAPVSLALPPTVASVQSALAALSLLRAPGDAAAANVTLVPGRGGAGGSLDVEIALPASSGDAPPLLVVSSAAMSGTGASAAVSGVQDGAPLDTFALSLTSAVGGAPLAGSLVLSLGAAATAPIALPTSPVARGSAAESAFLASIRAALEALPGVRHALVTPLGVASAAVGNASAVASTPSVFSATRDALAFELALVEVEPRVREAGGAAGAPHFLGLGSATVSGVVGAAAPAATVSRLGTDALAGLAASFDAPLEGIEVDVVLDLIGGAAGGDAPARALRARFPALAAPTAVDAALRRALVGALPSLAAADIRVLSANRTADALGASAEWRVSVGGPLAAALVGLRAGAARAAGDEALRRVALAADIPGAPALPLAPLPTCGVERGARFVLAGAPAMALDAAAPAEDVAAAVAASTGLPLDAIAVSRVPGALPGAAAWDVTFASRLGDVPALSASLLPRGAVAGAPAALAAGVTARAPPTPLGGALLPPACAAPGALAPAGIAIERRVHGVRAAVQRVALRASSVLVGGSFTLSLAGAATAPLPHDASAAEVAAALAALPSLGEGGVRVTPAPIVDARSLGAAWDITFAGWPGAPPLLAGNGSE
jgi:hypothetical protein